MRRDGFGLSPNDSKLRVQGSGTLQSIPFMMRYDNVRRGFLEPFTLINCIHSSHQHVLQERT